MDINPDSLRKGKYQTLFPEIYELKSVVENNSWHLNQNVFDHTLDVFKSLKKSLKLDFLKEKTRIKIKKYLREKYGHYSREEILFIAALLHDIGKPLTFIKDKTGLVMCPAHELIGSLMINKFAKRFNLDDDSEKRIVRIVCYHGFTNDILTLSFLKREPLKYLDFFKEITGNIYLELLLLMYADLKGCDLKKSSPDEFIKREKLIINFLES